MTPNIIRARSFKGDPLTQDGEEREWTLPLGESTVGDMTYVR